MVAASTGTGLFRQCRKLGWRQLAKANESILHLGVSVDGDKRNLRSGLGWIASQPRQDADEHRLVVQVMLEPQDQAVTFTGGLKSFPLRLQLANGFAKRHAVLAGDEMGAPFNQRVAGINHSWRQGPLAHRIGKFQIVSGYATKGQGLPNV